MTTRSKVLAAIRLRNHRLFTEFGNVGFDYIWNPDTNELHSTTSDAFWNNCNLRYANLRDFIGISNIGVIPLHDLPNNFEVPAIDLITGEDLGTLTINKCGHCLTF